METIDALARRCGLNRRDTFGLSVAYGVALTSEFHGTKVGAAIMYKGRIIGSGANSYKSDTSQKLYNRRNRTFENLGRDLPPHIDGIHAELKAIKSIGYTKTQETSFKSARLYVVRISKGQRYGIGLARPCPACMEAIRELGIRTVTYSTRDGFATERLI